MDTLKSSIAKTRRQLSKADQELTRLRKQSAIAQQRAENLVDRLSDKILTACAQHLERDWQRRFGTQVSCNWRPRYRAGRVEVIFSHNNTDLWVHRGRWRTWMLPPGPRPVDATPPLSARKVLSYLKEISSPHLKFVVGDNEKGT